MLPWEGFAQKKTLLTTMLERCPVLVPKEYTCHLYSLGVSSVRASGQVLGAAVEDGFAEGRRLEGFPGV